MRAVNLLPRQTSNQKLGIDPTIIAATAFTLVVAAAVAGGFFIEKAQAGTERQQLAVTQAALVQAQSQQPTTHSPSPAQLQIPAVLSQQQPWQAALESAFATRVAWDVLLEQLEYVVPARVTLTNVSLGSPGATGATGGVITLGGNAYSTKDVATLLATLARVPKLSQVTLVSSSSTPTSSVVAFQITAQMTLPVAATAPVTDTTTTTGTQG